MNSQSIQATAGHGRTGWATQLRSWRTAVGLTAAAGGTAIAVGAFLPWVEAFAGLIGVPGVRGSNGRIMLAAGIVIATAGLYHLIRGGDWTRWLVGLGGGGALAYSGFLLSRLIQSIRAMGGDSMVIARGGPGLWVIAAGSLLAFATLFLPSSSQATLVQPDRGNGILAWAADQESRGPRRRLQIALGLAWLLDAALQVQPYMFSRAFVTQTLAPSAIGSPAAVARPAMAASQLLLHNVAAWNAAFATIQLALAAGLLWRPAVKAALAASMVWSLAVWWLGEGLGGVLAGTASPLTGAPGAVILYALIALLAWPARSADRDDASVAAGDHASIAAGSAPASLATGSPLGRWARLLWLALWGSSAYLVLQAPVRAPGGLRASVAGLAAGEPRWIATLDHAIAAGAGQHGTLIAVLLAAVFAVIAVAIFVPAATRPVLALGIIVAAAIWVIGENFGGVLTGQATDPNTGPLLVLLALCFWPLPVLVHRHQAAVPVSLDPGVAPAMQADLQDAGSPSS